MKYKLHNGSGSLSCKSCGRQDKQLNTYDWLADVPGNNLESQWIEVQFKNTRKGYFRNSNNLPIEKGDIVAVEATPGHDIGTVTLTGSLVPLQMRKANIKSEADLKRVYRKAKPVDLEKYEEAKSKEHDTMIRSRQIAKSLNLEMKIGDVEYQGDGNKAIFYYIAEGRVDFRQLIKVLAEVFKVRIEMKQIGARQEAGRIGGIGPCGRELCCATWMTSFISVSTAAARYQDISLNPQKLAGQCAKLKCCLNYEVDCYMEAQRRLPSKEVILQTQDADYYFFKADILANQITYSTDKATPTNLVTIKARRAFEVIGMNRRGQKPENLLEIIPEKEDKNSVDLVEQESLTRFDKSKKNRNSDSRDNNRNKRKKRNNNTDTKTNQPVAANSPKDSNVQETDKKVNKDISTDSSVKQDKRDQDNKNNIRNNRPERKKKVHNDFKSNHVNKEEGKGDNKESHTVENASKPKEEHATHNRNNRPRQKNRPINTSENNNEDRIEKAPKNTNNESSEA